MRACLCVSVPAYMKTTQAERASRGGKLPGRLDAEGYNPAGLQGAYGAPTEGSGAGAGTLDGSIGKSGGGGAPSAAPEGTPIEQVEKAIGLMKRQRIGVSKVDQPMH